MGPSRRSIVLVLGASLLAFSCQAAESPPLTEPRPSPREPGGEEELCQPFPDHLFDGFLSAYRQHDVDALSSLVQVDGIHDLSAIAGSGRVEFDDVAEWARSGWDTDDRFNA